MSVTTSDIFPANSSVDYDWQRPRPHRHQRFLAKGTPLPQSGSIASLVSCRVHLLATLDIFPIASSMDCNWRRPLPHRHQHFSAKGVPLALAGPITHLVSCLCRLVEITFSQPKPCLLVHLPMSASVSSYLAQLTKLPSSPRSSTRPSRLSLIRSDSPC